LHSVPHRLEFGLSLLQAVCILLELERDKIASQAKNKQTQWAHLSLELTSYSVLFVCLDDNMEIIQVVYDERILAIHH
jgi:hypothetical protein